jgi:rhamnosyltransferase
MNSCQNQNVPRVAVLLAVFNGVAWLEEQILSILRQKDIEVTLYISVDLSDDNTEQLVVLLSEKYSKIKHLDFGKHLGGAALNFYHLLSMVNFQDFDYIALADQDDVWLPGKLKRAISCLSVLNAHAYSSNATAFWDDGRKIEIIKSQKQTTWDFLFESAGPGCTYVLTQNIVLQIQLMLQEQRALVNTIYMHDWLIYAFVRSKKYRWFIDDNSYILYRQHKHNVIGVNIGINAFVGRSQKVLSGWALGQSLQIAFILGLHSSPFVRIWEKGQRIAYLNLSRYSWQCRRKFIDKVIFFLACLGMFIVGSKINHSMLSHK